MRTNYCMETKSSREMEEAATEMELRRTQKMTRKLKTAI